MTLKATLKEFIEQEKYEPDASEVNRFRKMRSLDEAVKTAAESKREDGRYYPHQRRNVGWRDAIPKATKTLVSASDHFRACRDFEEIKQLIKDLLADTTGVGPVYYYDVAVRIAAYLKKLPKKVHLHAGVLEGAKLLEEDEELPEGATKKGFLEVDELPNYLKEFEPHEVETLLCNYANHRRWQSRD
jgi:hypothetical protein